ncbi:MAG TPA: ATP-binding protein, partial [Cyanophyceae cyanobacterium]
MSVSMHTANPTWIEANQRYLIGEIARIRQILQQNIPQTQEQPIEQIPITPQLKQLSPPPSLEQLCYVFQLSAFERS